MHLPLRVALLGGYGLVGTELAHARKGDWDVLRLDSAVSASPIDDVDDRALDILDEEELAVHLSGVDVAVHLANVPIRTPPPYSAALIRDTFAVNVGSVYASIRACARSGVKSLIHVSSMSVFTDARSGDPTGNGDALEPYGLSKRLAESACSALSHIGPTITSVRIAFPTPDASWPQWLRPSDRELVPLLFDGDSYQALPIGDLARAIDLLAPRGGDHMIVALAGDRRLAPTIEDLEVQLQESAS
jgi:nucleoside-diphosphate-sugar epimerase